MNDGINAWKESGYPVKGNTAPEKPIITGPTYIKAGNVSFYTFVASDPDQDYLFCSAVCRRYCRIDQWRNENCPTHSCCKK